MLISDKLPEKRLKIMAKTREYDIETSLTLDYRKMAWGIERIVLDSISNHLPADSNGTQTSVKFRQDGELVDFSDYNPEKDISEIVFEDNGSGYDAGLLSVLFSPKAADAMSVGQFGEGLKMVAAASLREGMEVEYRSRNWRARPFAQAEKIGGKFVKRLCFHVTENGDQLEGSRTVFKNPPKRIIGEILQLPDKVLAMNGDYEVLYDEGNPDKFKPKQNVGHSLIDIYDSALNKLSKGDFFVIGDYPIINKSLDNASDQFFIGNNFSRNLSSGPINLGNYNSRILKLGEGKNNALFVKGVKVQGIQSIFSYDLGMDNISPDRIFANHGNMMMKIEGLLMGCTNTEVIETVLNQAVNVPGVDRGYLLEIEAFGYASRKFAGSGVLQKSYVPLREVMEESSALFERMVFKSAENLWVETFYKIFGEGSKNVVLSSDVNSDADARAMGYTVVDLNFNVAQYLTSSGVKKSDQLNQELEYRWVDESDLTDDERYILGTTRSIDEYVLEDGVSPSPEVRVYGGLFNSAGREIESSLGAQITELDGTKYIGVKRSSLGDRGEFIKTYIHELAHYVTGAGDFDRRFVDFAFNAISRLAMANLGETSE